ncbi:MAG: DUF4440 domain-containing protein [Bacteroidota bacterium]|nr:DUF4440 domain-containing protein [Bacteroidota bacterium]
MKEIGKGDFEELRELEESLWVSKTRFDIAHVSRIFAPDFFEFGKSGKIYTREEALAAPPHEINPKLPLRNFKVHPITSEVVLVTYVSEVQSDTLEVTNRSSLWLRTPNGWRLRFHQGTPVRK